MNTIKIRMKLQSKMYAKQNTKTPKHQISYRCRQAIKRGNEEHRNTFTSKNSQCGDTSRVDITAAVDLIVGQPLSCGCDKQGVRRLLWHCLVWR